MLPAWVDEDDERIKVNLKARNKLKKLIQKDGSAVVSGREFQKALQSHNHKLHDWALTEPEQAEAKGNIDSLLQTTKRASKKQGKKESYLRIKDLPEVHKSVLTSVQFSPQEDSVLVTAGLDRILRVHNLADSTSVQLDTLDMPIHSAGFLNAAEVLATGRRKHCYLFDLQAGKLSRLVPNLPTLRSLERCFTSAYSAVYAFSSLEGSAFLFDSKAKQPRNALKINGAVLSMAFASENYVFLSGEQAEVYVFDLRKSFKCLRRFQDEGSLETLSLDCQPRHWRYLAAGQKSGVVNIYDLDDILLRSDEVRPCKVWLLI